MTRRSTRRDRKRLLEQQEGLCGLCWLPLTTDITTDHILPQKWHDKIGKSDKHRTANLQAAHASCNRTKANYPGPWNRHLLRLCLAQIRGQDLDEDALLWRLAGEKPTAQNTPLLPGPEWVHLSTSFGWVVPYIHMYFEEQGMAVPQRIRRDQFEPQFTEWLQQEPMRTWRINEQAVMQAQAPEMWNRALEHEFRCQLRGHVRGSITMRPGFTMPADAKGPPMAIRSLDDVGVLFEGFIWPTEDPLTFVMSKRRDDMPAEAIDTWHRAEL